MRSCATVTYYFHTARHLCGNFALVNQRRCAGHIVSMHQSGTHWLKFMLANALAHHYELPAPQYNHANDFIRGPRDPVRYPVLPDIISSHGIPHLIQQVKWLAPHFSAPRYLVLVRDLRAALESNYQKWQQRYDVPFSVYLRGDPSGRRYNSDLWWAIRFLNAWSRVRRRLSGRVKVVRYEALQLQRHKTLAAVGLHLDLDLNAADLIHGGACGDRATMAAREDPERPPGAVQSTPRASLAYFQSEERKYFETIVARFLRDDYGYNYSLWECAARC